MCDHNLDFCYSTQTLDLYMFFPAVGVSEIPEDGECL